MTSARDRRIHSLRDPDYRHEYVSEHINQGVAFQVRATRKARGWTQSALGERAGMSQERISKVEDPDYGRFTLSTLKRLGRALDIALLVEFVPFSELVSRTTSRSQASLAVPSFSTDPGLHELSGQTNHPKAFRDLGSTGHSLTHEVTQTEYQLTLLNESSYPATVVPFRTKGRRPDGTGFVVSTAQSGSR